MKKEECVTAKEHFERIKELYTKGEEITKEDISILIQIIDFCNLQRVYCITEINEQLKENDRIYADKFNKLQNFCYNKMKEYKSLLQIFEPEDEIIKISKIERDFAQQILTILF